MKNRIDLIQFCIDTFNYKKYLELGVKKGECFNSINIDYKVGVDCVEGYTTPTPMTTDEFFEYNKETFDIVFVDATHTHQQVRKDIENSLKILNKGGLIISHDNCPMNKEDESDQNIRCGNSWKYFTYLRTLDNLDCACSDFDFGCGVIKIKQNTQKLVLEKNYQELMWDDLVANREKYLRLLKPNDLMNWIKQDTINLVRTYGARP